ncbi:MAG: hypothetical protein SNJ77_10045 [Cytophagales bacterium]
MFSATQKTKLVSLLNAKIDIPIIGETMEAAIISPLVDTIGASISKLLPANAIASLTNPALASTIDTKSLTSSLNSSVMTSISSKLGQANANIMVNEVVKLITEAGKSGKSLDSLLNNK